MKRLVFVILLLILIPMHLAAAERCTKAKVVKVIDGDTIKVACRGNKFTIRLIGIDTPETRHPKKHRQCYGREASQYLKKRIDRKRVRLEYDEEQHDKYGRTLAYVYRGKTSINAEMIKKGYAFAYRRFPFKYRKAFIDYEKEARRQGRGLWSACPLSCKGSVCHTGGEHHVPGR